MKKSFQRKISKAYAEAMLTRTEMSSITYNDEVLESESTSSSNDEETLTRLMTDIQEETKADLTPA